MDSLNIPEGMKPCEGYKCWRDSDGVYRQHVTAEGASLGSSLCSHCLGKGYVAENYQDPDEVIARGDG